MSMLTLANAVRVRIFSVRPCLRDVMQFWRCAIRMQRRLCRGNELPTRVKLGWNYAPALCWLIRP